MKWNEVKKLLIHLAGACALVIGISWIILEWLDWYTRHGEEMPAPVVEGLTLDSAMALLDSVGMRWEVIDSVFSDTLKPHQVVKQSPAPGTPIKKGRKFYLIVNASAPPLISVPDLIDLPLEIAKKRLEAAGFRLGEVRFKPDIAHMVVLEQLVDSQAVAPGTFLPYGSTIDLVVGFSSDTGAVEVPLLVCLRFAQARTSLMRSVLSPGAIMVMLDSANSIPADSAHFLQGVLDTFFVYSQYPPHSKIQRVPPGTPVDLYLTPTKPPACDSSSRR